MIASALLLVAAAAMSVGFLLVRGGFDLPAAAAGRRRSPWRPRTPSAVAVADRDDRIAPSSAPTDGSGRARRRPRRRRDRDADPSPAPTPAPTPAPAARSNRRPPSRRATATLLLDPCPDAADCWVYTVRAGDNLRSIVNYFGVPYDTVLDDEPPDRRPDERSTPATRSACRRRPADMAAIDYDARRGPDVRLLRDAHRLGGGDRGRARGGDAGTRRRRPGRGAARRRTRGTRRRSRRGPYLRYREVLAEACRGVCADLGVEPTDDEVAAFAGSVGEWPAFPDSAAALAALAARFRLGVITNCDDDLFAASNRRLGVTFDWIITAQQAGSYKPSHRNFELAFERIGRPRDRILHVAQSLFHDHVPAKELGLRSVWINRRGDRPGSGATPPADGPAGRDVPGHGLVRRGRAPGLRLLTTRSRVIDLAFNPAARRTPSAVCDFPIDGSLDGAMMR